VKHTITIQRHRPWLRPVLVTVAAAVLALGSWGLYSYSRLHAVSDFERTQIEVEQLREERRQLVRELRSSKGEVGDLKDQVTYEKRSSEIDVQACDTVRESLGAMQTEVSNLREQLAFYRGIVSPDLSRAGVRIYDLKLKPGKTSGSFQYELVLIQSVRHDRRISGRIELALEGAISGKPQTLNWSSVAQGEGKNLLFSFKYFEEFSGELRLPFGFRPLRVTARLVMDDNMPSIEDQFDWDKVVANQEKT
jgi:hypothetical protein